MEYVAGGELYNIIRYSDLIEIAFRKQIKSKQEHILFYLAEIGSAVEYLHRRGVAYRDLKPENVMLDARGHAKLVDFGFAKRLVGGRTATVCGTPGYLAPEQVEGKGSLALRNRLEYGLEVDLWAFGVLAFELLAGYNPFSSEGPVETYQNVVQAQINWPPYMSRAAKDFIKKLLVLDPKERLPAEKFKLEPLLGAIDWDTVSAGKGAPPYVPTLSGPFDTSYFYKYPDETEIDKKMNERLSLLKVQSGGTSIENGRRKERLFEDF